MLDEHEEMFEVTLSERHERDARTMVPWRSASIHGQRRRALA